MLRMWELEACLPAGVRIVCVPACASVRPHASSWCLFPRVSRSVCVGETASDCVECRAIGPFRSVLPVAATKIDCAPLAAADWLPVSQAALHSSRDALLRWLRSSHTIQLMRAHASLTCQRQYLSPAAVLPHSTLANLEPASRADSASRTDPISACNYRIYLMVFGWILSCRARYGAYRSLYLLHPALPQLQCKRCTTHASLQLWSTGDAG